MSADIFSNNKNSLNALTPATFTLTTVNPDKCKRAASAYRFFLLLTEPQFLGLI
jgi:hypothetical protein